MERLEELIFTTDVQYAENNVLATGLHFPCWKSDEIEQQIIKTIYETAPYEPDAFYKRELPCLLSWLDEFEISLDAIVIDGFVKLGGDEKGGLGIHLYNATQQTTQSLTWQKNTFIGTPEYYQIFRGINAT